MTNTPAHSPAAVPGDRAPIPRLAGERESMEAFLEWHRRTFELKCEGLGQEELSSRTVAPSTLSLHGLARHLAGCERWWFRQQFAGEDVPILYYSDEDPDQDMDSLDGDAQEALAVWRSECARSREIVAAAESLDQRGTSLRTGEPFTLRWMLLSLIAEYARHNGHADLLREAIDGKVGH